MKAQTIKRPSIPVEFYDPSSIGTISFIVYALTLFILPATLCRIVATEIEFIPLRFGLIIPLTIISGYGLQLMGFVGHEGFHLSLHRNKLVSALLGLFCASSVVTYFEIGFAMQHWNHHRFTNQASDVDVRQVEHLKTWWQRILFSRAIYNIHYFKMALKTALGYPLPFAYQMPFKPFTVRLLCYANFGFALFWIGIYVGVIWWDPLTGVFSLALPMLVALLISGCQTYLDHAGTSSDLFCNAWSRTSPLMTILYFGANYHLEHHLYPGVPCYRLYKVHQLLKESGVFEKVKSPIQTSFFGAYRNLCSEYNSGKKDSGFDPFKPAIDSDISKIK